MVARNEQETEAGRDENGAEDETRAEHKRRREQSKRGRSSSWGRAKTRGRRRDRREETKQSKTGRVPCNEREMREPEFAGKARSFIGSPQQQLSARGDCSHVHTRRDAHLASLTPLTGAARAQLREARARAQHRLRGALQACGALITRYVIMGAYIPSPHLRKRAIVSLQIRAEECECQ